MPVVWRATTFAGSLKLSTRLRHYRLKRCRLAMRLRGGMFAKSFVSFVLCLFVQTASGQNSHVVDRFEEKNSLKRWTFSNGPEFPGAMGDFHLGPGHTGQGAVLEYRFYCQAPGDCGRYVSANWKPDARLDTKRVVALSFWTRCPPSIAIRIRVRDKDGQTLQFTANNLTLEHRDPDDWQHVIVPLNADSSAGHWGGRDNGSLKGKIGELGILAEARYPYPMEGTVGLDDIELLDSFDTSLHLDPNAELVPAPAGAAQFDARLGVNDHVLRDEHSLDIARDAGFKLVRLDLRWQRVERNGEYRFEQADRILNAFESRGLGALAILDYGHPQHGGETPQTADDIAAYARYAEAVAMHFKGHKIRYEIWNEPNLARFWKPRPDADAYTALLRQAVAAIRRADPSAPISTGGVANFDLAFLSRMLHSGSAAEVNAIGIHPYRDSGPETVVSELLTLRRMIDGTLGQRVEIWSTEWGYSSARIGVDRQAVLAVRQALTLWAFGLPLAIWYDLRDDGTDPRNPEHNFGLLDSGGREKPAMAAIRTLAKAASGRTYAGLVRDVPEGVHAMCLDAPAGKVFIVWTEGQSRTVDFPDGILASATDMSGAPILPEAANSGKSTITLDESRGPVYLFLKQ